MKKTLIPFLALLLLAIGCGPKKTVIQKHAEKATKTDYVPQRVEMRAAWIPTVFRDQYARMSTQELQDFFRKKLDQLKEMGVNAVFFQVRCEADAWYYSPNEPWSRFFTGNQDQAPEPFWDPLAFMIDECHQRCMELHAWINPYRASTKLSLPLGDRHPYHRHPEWFVKYGDLLLFNPALREVQDYTCRIVADIVSRYDVDGLHMDDYFYPYPVAGVPFPDRDEYRRMGEPRGLSIGDFRRDNVNQLIHKMHDTVKQIKPYVRFGVSPFGIYRNEKSDPTGSKTNGLQNYDDLYADILLWDQMNWVDYVAPQLYWHMGHKLADYTELAYWWSKNIRNSHYYIGQSVRPTMDHEQLHPKLNIATETSQGNVIWPADELFVDYKGITTKIQKDYWQYPALIPASPYPAGLEDFPEPKRSAHLLVGELYQELVWLGDVPMPPGLETRYYVIYTHKRGASLKEIQKPENVTAITNATRYRPLDLGKKFKVAFTITRVDRYNHEHIVARDIPALL